MENNNEILLKRLLYRSLHRGCKETDILLGKYAQGKLDNFDDSELQLYKDFIEEDDLGIYNWIVGKEEAPEKYKDLVGDVCLFHGL